MKTILITDDDIHIGNMLDEILTREGYGVLRAYSGTEALMILENKHPDLVLLDLMLPGMNGEEVLPKIKDIPTIIISAKAGISDSQVIESELYHEKDYIYCNIIFADCHSGRLCSSGRRRRK